MIFYALLRFIDGVNFTAYNPFAQYEYGIGVSMAVECILLLICFWVGRLIAYRINNKTKSMRALLTAICYICSYPIVWCCFWIPNTAIAAALAILATTILAVLALCIIDLFVKERLN